MASVEDLLRSLQDDPATRSTAVANEIAEVRLELEARRRRALFAMACSLGLSLIHI